jgi:hypothetical protein
LLCEEILCPIWPIIRPLIRKSERLFSVKSSFRTMLFDENFTKIYTGVGKMQMILIRKHTH